jgi:hypothetical protein
MYIYVHTNVYTRLQLFSCVQRGVFPAKEAAKLQPSIKTVSFLVFSWSRGISRQTEAAKVQHLKGLIFFLFSAWSRGISPAKRSRETGTTKTQVAHLSRLSLESRLLDMLHSLCPRSGKNGCMYVYTYMHTTYVDAYTYIQICTCYTALSSSSWEWDACICIHTHIYIQICTCYTACAVV